MSELSHIADEATNPADVRVAAMNLLARREHSLEELRRKLRRRFDDGPVIEVQLQQLVDENLQSDERYAQSFVRQRASRGYGPVRIVREAREKGLSSSEIQSAMEAVNVDWCDRAREVLHKKFGLEPVSELKEKARRIRFMQYRGFDPEHIREWL